MATSAEKKIFEEAFIYCKRIEALDKAYVSYGDYFDVRFTSTSVLNVVAGTEADDSAISDVIYVIALSAVKSAKTIVGTAMFTGSGLDDCTSGGTFNGALQAEYEAEIDATGAPDTFKWRKRTRNADGSWNAWGSYTTGVAITGSAQTLDSAVTITFPATTGHTLADKWTVRTSVTEIRPNANYSTDTVQFDWGDPVGTMKSATLTAVLSSTELAAGQGNAGDRFLVLKDPNVDSADGMLMYVQSKSETQVGEGERAYYDKGIFKGVKKIPVSEPNTISLAEHFQAHDRGLLKYKGHRFNMLVERDVNREGTISEREYYMNCLFNVGGPNEAIGDTDSDFSLDIQYLFKGVVAS